MDIALYKKKLQSIQKSGFTVVELMVTITIVVLVTGIIMLQYSSFNSSVLLKSQAYLTAFDVREAQSLAVSVRAQAGPSSAQFYEQYGLFFDITKSHQYLLFQDNDANNAGVDISPAHYDTPDDDNDSDIEEKVGAPYLIDPRFEIVNICAIVGVNRTCTSSSVTFRTLAISFKRPDFDATFYTPGVTGQAQAVEIHFAKDSSSSLIRTVTIYTTGQIKID